MYDNSSRTRVTALHSAKVGLADESVDAAAYEADTPEPDGARASLPTSEASDIDSFAQERSATVFEVARDSISSGMNDEQCVRDVTGLFLRSEVTRPISIRETSSVYPHKSVIEENWSYYTVAAFRHLRELFPHCQLSSVAIVGIGSGVEGIAAAHLFPGLRELIVCDIEEKITELAVENIRRNHLPPSCELSGLTGSLCDPLRGGNLRVNLLYANIPNLLAPDEIRGKLSNEGSGGQPDGAERGTFFLPEEVARYTPPQELVQWALASQYAYLTGARSVLAAGGRVVTALGGRMPEEVLRRLFTECGYDMSELVLGFKEQTEARIDYIGYHELEARFGVKFEFYRYEESRLSLVRNGVQNPSSAITRKEASSLVAPFRVSAGEALALHEKGIRCGHFVQILLGTPR